MGVWKSPVEDLGLKENMVMKEKHLLDLEFYKGKRILLTGHMGFKGSWLSKILLDGGAEVTGYSLESPTKPGLFALCGLEGNMRSVLGDIRDLEHLKRVFREARPEIVLHLAAQPIVRDSYVNPVLTYETNVMGTVHICECIRLFPGVKSLLNVTTDKVYENREWAWGYRETDALDGYDPYSNSKSCSELVTHSYQKAFLKEAGTAVSTARAGNVIGGGDFAKDRIIPDCVRAIEKGEPVVLRNPHSIRPYQHVLEPLMAYLLIARQQYEEPGSAGCYNVGPEDSDCVTTGELVEMFCRAWGEGASWRVQGDDGPHEANFLKLDVSKLKAGLGWRPRWTVEEALEKTAEWYKCWMAGGDICGCMEAQVAAYLKQ